MKPQNAPAATPATIASTRWITGGSSTISPT